MIPARPCQRAYLKTSAAPVCADSLPAEARAARFCGQAGYDSGTPSRPEDNHGSSSPPHRSRPQQRLGPRLVAHHPEPARQRARRSRDRPATDGRPSDGFHRGAEIILEGTRNTEHVLPMIREVLGEAGA
jgi:hypothetical protein